MRNRVEVRGLVLLAVLASASAAAAEQLSVREGVRRENLTVYPIVAETWQAVPRFATLDEALASGEASVREQQGGGQVGRLMLSYRGRTPLLLLAGEVVVGGQQDRVIVADRIVAPGTQALPLDVFCVEQGRWAGAAAFDSGNMIAHPSVRERAAVDKQQAEVWNSVAVGSVAETVTVAAAPPPLQAAVAYTMREVESGSYAKAYSKSRVAQPVERLAKQIASDLSRATEGAKGVVGLVVAYGGEVAWADRFGSPELFRRYSDKLLKSYAVEALARPNDGKRASLDAARAYLSSLESGARGSDASEPGLYLFRERSDGRHAELELTALGPQPSTVHWVKVRRNR